MSVYLPYYIHSPQNQASTYSLAFLIIIVREGFADFILNFIFWVLIFFPLFSPGAQLRWMRLDITRGARASGATAGLAAPFPLMTGRPQWWCLTLKVGAYHISDIERNERSDFGFLLKLCGTRICLANFVNQSGFRKLAANESQVEGGN